MKLRTLSLFLLTVALVSSSSGCDATGPAVTESPEALSSSAAAVLANEATSSDYVGELVDDVIDGTLTPSEAAKRAFRGADLEGKDGPLAKIGLDLSRLYFSFRLHQAESPSTPFDAPDYLPVSNGRLTIDATASADASQLLSDLEALGLQGGAAFRSLVSGRLPIAALPEAADLTTLRGLRPALASTQPPENPSPSPIGFQTPSLEDF